ncbi:MAG TPA: type I glutamate--ammonia ligase [Methanosarcinales archaeon]|nr:type I glutamate--ammonia ligase [Methanosarcinales archaeon]
MTYEDAKKILKDAEVKNVLCFFSDIRGILQSFTIPSREFIDGDAYAEGVGFDGSSIRGFKTIEKSDMIWMPDAETTTVIPWISDPIQKSAIIFGDIYEAFGEKVGGGVIADCDPRGYVGRNAIKEAESMGYKAIFGPEIEYFVFESLDPTKLVYDLWVSPNGGTADSWGPPRVMPKSPEITPGGLILRPKEAYFRAPPEDTTNDFRNEVCKYLDDMDVKIEYHHHEVATAGQIELNYKPKDVIGCGDDFFKYKFVGRNIAARYGWIATFMPKPLYLDNASGMHTHQSLWTGDPFKGENAFYDPDDEYYLSQTARYYIGGLIEHAKALTAICAPTVNSYKRLVPGFEAPINISWSPRNRSALVRVPLYFTSPKAVRCEYRAADPSCNPYLAFSAMLAAGLDGIKKKIDPGDPLRADMYELTPTQKREYGVGELPTTLRDALDHLSTDEVLQRALGDHLFCAFIELKTNEWNQYCLYVTPWEIMKYLDY